MILVRNTPFPPIFYSSKMVLTSDLAIAARLREESRVRKPSKPLQARPIPAGIRDNGRRYSIAQRTQCLSYLAIGVSRDKIREITGIPYPTQSNILKKARERGFDPSTSLQIVDYYVEDRQKTGRPKEVAESTRQALLDSVAVSRASREQTAEVLAYKHGVSYSTALNILREAGYSSVKPTRKPGLSKTQRAARLQFCLDHQHWTLEDWKKVIWTDETSVILGAHRGAVRLWRRADEGASKTVIRNRWKGYSEFIFWGSFSYDHKGPCHIYKKETVADKRLVVAELEAWNRDLEPSMKAEWEIATEERRAKLRKRSGGRKPMWKFSKATGKSEMRHKMLSLSSFVVFYSMWRR